jgi:hypothetical protein
MFSWLSTIFGSSKKSPKTPSPPPPPPPPPKLVTIFNTVSRLSPDGEKNSPINLEPKPKKRKRNPKSWKKEAKPDNQKSITRAANILRNNVTETLGLYTPRPSPRIVSTKTGSNSTTGTKSILKRHRSTGGNNTRKL